MFSFESYKVFKNTYFTEHLRATASVFCIFSSILVKKTCLNDFPVFQKQ